jgi:hypothetical protein
VISSRANDRTSTGKAAAVMSMCVAAVVIGILVEGGGVNGRRSREAGIQVVRVPPKTEHRDAADSISRVIANDFRAPVSASDGRNWDDGGANLDAMAVEIRAETRDPAWASQQETRLRVRLARAVTRDASPPEVRCAVTMCEVVGSMTSAIAPDDVGRTLQSLQSSDMRDALIEASLVGGPTIVNSGKGRRYVLYYRRQAY